MKAASLLRQFFAACFICGMLIAGSSMAYASVANNGAKGKAEVCAKQELAVQQNDPLTKKKADASSTIGKENPAQKVVDEKPEVKKESSASQASFSFLYYLFYKGNFAETTNNAIRSSLSNAIRCLLD